MADTVGGSGHARDSGTNDGDVGSSKWSVRVWRGGRKYLATQVLPNLISEQDWVDERVLDLGFGRHRGLGCREARGTEQDVPRNMEEEMLK